MNARSYLHVYVKRGLVKKEPCRVCGSLKSQSHHPDYSKPLEVIWLCRFHHKFLHDFLKDDWNNHGHFLSHFSKDHALKAKTFNP